MGCVIVPGVYAEVFGNKSVSFRGCVGVCLLGGCVYVCAWCVSVRECTCRGSTTGGPWLAMLTCVGSSWLIEPTMMS